MGRGVRHVLQRCWLGLEGRFAFLRAVPFLIAVADTHQSLESVSPQLHWGECYESPPSPAPLLLASVVRSQGCPRKTWQELERSQSETKEQQ